MPGCWPPCTPMRSAASPARLWPAGSSESAPPGDPAPGAVADHHLAVREPAAGDAGKPREQTLALARRERRDIGPAALLGDPVPGGDRSRPRHGDTGARV